LERNPGSAALDAACQELQAMTSQARRAEQP